MMKKLDRIRFLREEKHLTQKDMGRLLNMSHTGYSKYETGENDLSTEIVKKLSCIHDVSIDYLLGITDEKNPYKRNEDFDEIKKPINTKE